MKRFTLAHSVLLNILNDEKYTFSIALANAFKNEKNKTINRHDISALVGASLRHYYVFKERLIEHYGELDNNRLAYGLIAMANAYFVRMLDSRKVNDEFARLGELENLNDFISSLSVDKLIPEKYTQGTIEFLSYRFNTPMWLIGMWKKHYGESLTYRLLKTNSKTPNRYYTAKEEYDFSTNFEPTKVEGVYRLVSKGPAPQKDELLPSIPALNYALNLIDLDPIRGMAIYSEVPSFLIHQLSNKVNKFSHIDFIGGKPIAYLEANRILKAIGLNNIATYEANVTGLITVISQPVHTFFVLPDNSRYSLLRERPDFFLRIKQEDLDGFIAHEYECLEESAKFVEEDGQLIYFIETISNKEGHGVIDRFLKEHKEFTAVDEKQFFPCNSMESAFYFAILRKKGN